MTKPQRLSRSVEHVLIGTFVHTRKAGEFVRYVLVRVVALGSRPKK